MIILLHFHLKVGFHGVLHSYMVLNSIFMMYAGLGNALQLVDKFPALHRMCCTFLTVLTKI
jgi:hypothetical protein